MTDILTVIEGLDFVVSLAEGHVHPDDLTEARGHARAVRERTGHLGTNMVLALVGGTGSGKSSLLNALAGEAVASVSAVRPHTTRPLAWIPEPPGDALTGLLDRLEIEDRIAQTKFPGLAILDLADTDSLEPSHRQGVERLLPDVDVVVWVLDPVKYADPGLHRELIEPLADSARQFVFVLNRADTLELEALAIVRSDLVSRLADDGIVDPEVFVVAADPPSGVPQGIEPLEEHLRGRLDEKKVHMGKVIADARGAAHAIASAAGVTGGGTLDFEAKWARFRDSAVTSLSIDGPTIGAYERALCALEDLVGELSVEAGGPFGVRLRQAFAGERLDDELRAAVRVMDSTVPRIAGRDGKPGPLSPERRAEAAELLDGELQQRIGAELRKILWERASLSSVVAGLAVDSSMAEATLRMVD